MGRGGSLVFFGGVYVGFFEHALFVYSLFFFVCGGVTFKYPKPLFLAPKNFFFLKTAFLDPPRGAF